MNTKLVNTTAGVILAALEQNRTAAGIALALESAQMLMTPETAAELVALRARDAALLTVMNRVRDMSSDVVDTEGKPVAPGCSVWGLLSDLAVVRGLDRAPEHNQWSGVPYPDEPDEGAFEEASTHAEFVLPPTQAPREDEPEAPDFFQRGRTYLRFVGDRELYFRVTSVSTDNPNQPDSLAGDGPVAHGWVRTERSATVWGPGGYTTFAGWHDVTEPGGA